MSSFVLFGGEKYQVPIDAQPHSSDKKSKADTHLADAQLSHIEPTFVR